MLAEPLCLRCLRPAWVTLLLVTALQHVLAKFAFIKKEAGTRDLNNRSVKPAWFWGLSRCT